MLPLFSTYRCSNRSMWGQGGRPGGIDNKSPLIEGRVQGISYSFTMLGLTCILVITTATTSVKLSIRGRGHLMRKLNLFLYLYNGILVQISDNLIRLICCNHQGGLLSTIRCLGNHWTQWLWFLLGPNLWFFMSSLRYHHPLHILSSLEVKITTK